MRGSAIALATVRLVRRVPPLQPASQTRRKKVGRGRAQKLDDEMREGRNDNLCS